jgi:hypothetical protein
MSYSCFQAELVGHARSLRETLEEKKKKQETALSSRVRWVATWSARAISKTKSVWFEIEMSYTRLIVSIFTCSGLNY